MDKAVEAYTEAIGLKEKYVKVLKRRSKLFCAMGRNQEALDGIII